MTKCGNYNISNETNTIHPIASKTIPKTDEWLLGQLKFTLHFCNSPKQTLDLIRKRPIVLLHIVLFVSAVHFSVLLELQSIDELIRSRVYIASKEKNAKKQEKQVETANPFYS